MLYLFFGLFLAVGLGILGTGVRAWIKSNAVGGWPSTWGTLTERELVESSDSDGTTYRVKVRYLYRVAGVEYAADRIAFGYGGSSGYASHRALHEKLASGDAVQVRYNPRAPGEAALAHGFNRSTLFLLIFGTVWTLFTVGLFALFFLSERPDTALLERVIVR
ncbi:MAG: DUF3592 domain-containing protein [Pseudomonadota bacterium]